MELTGIDQSNYHYFAALLFGEGYMPPGHTILAGVIDEGMPCGAAAMNVNWQENHAVLTSIYTIGMKRRMGAGRMMLEAMVKAARALGLREIRAYGTSGMDGLDKLLSAQGFEVFSDGCEEVYSVADLLASNKAARYLNRNFRQEIYALRELSEKQRRTLKQKLAAYPSIIIDESTDEALTFAVMGNNAQEIKAVLLSHRNPELKAVVVDFMTVFSGESTNIIVLFAHLLQCLSNEPDSFLSFLSVNPKVSEFMNELAVPSKGQNVFHGIQLLN